VVQPPANVAQLTDEPTYDIPQGGAFDCGTVPATHLVTTSTIPAGATTLPNGNCVANAWRRNGTCTCQDGLVVCGAACVDATSDPENCGGCGRSCGPTAACTAGVCGPSPTRFGLAAPGCVSMHLAASGETLYWTDEGHGTVNAQPVAGCARTTIASSESHPTLLVAEGANLFWVSTPSVSGGGGTSTTATIRTVGLSGGAPRDLASETNTTGGILGLVVSEDGRTLYYSAGTAVRAVPVAGGVAFDVGREERGGIPTALAREGNMIAYLTGLNGNLDTITVEDGVVARCDVPDPAKQNGQIVMQNCARNWGCIPEPYFGGLLIRDWRLYWGNGTSLYRGVFSWERDSIAWAPDDSPMSGVAGGTTAVYVAFSGYPDSSPAPSSGWIERAPDTGTDPAAILARGQIAPTSLVAAGGRVFWATGDCGINSTVE
jgi:hypothetical protein